MADGRWYVNLPEKPAKNEGNKVPLSVPGKKLKKKRGWAQWEVDADGKNTDTKYLSSTERAHHRDSRSISNRKKKAFRNQLILPHVGGDKYKSICKRIDKLSEQQERLPPEHQGADDA